MPLFSTPHQKRAALLTTLIGLLLLFLFLIIGLSYYDPPISYGVAVNFGTSNTGGGVAPPKPIEKSIPKPTPQTQKAKETPTPTPKQTVTQKTVTQEKSSLSVPEEKTKKVEPKTEAPKKVEEKTTPPPPKPKVDERTKDILKNLVQAQDNQSAAEATGEGDDTAAEDKGKSNGDPYASSYYTAAGSGGEGTQYGLNGRSLQNKGAVVQDCNEEGIVVVRITVDQNGRVVDAQPGVKGTTNSHPCLLAPAKATALKHQWNVDFNAPNKQIGFIVIQFKLGE